jgi:Tfp pilus assembly protein PilF
VFGELTAWLGKRRMQALVALLVGTVLTIVGLQLAASGEEWVFVAQLALVWVFLASVALILSARLTPAGRQRLWLSLGPGLVLLGLGLVFPDWALFFGGGGLGWMVTAQIVLRNRVRMEYQTAIQHLRRSEYPQAIAMLDRLIEAEPDDANHYRFRAELQRLANKLPAARRDYERVIDLQPADSAGYIGLAEVYAQQRQYDNALDYARQAFEAAPHQWLTAYNLGMIEDRHGDAEAAITHLEQALTAGLPHSRYRLLTRLWLARNYYRTGQRDTARQQIDAMREQAGGLDEWRVVLDSEQAAALRDLLAGDVALAERVLDGDVSLDDAFA